MAIFELFDLWDIVVYDGMVVIASTTFTSLPPPSLSHSPDLGCVRAHGIMFLGRFLVQLTHLLSGGPRLARMWLILDLARNKCLDSENQGTIL